MDNVLSWPENNSKNKKPKPKKKNFFWKEIKLHVPFKGVGDEDGARMTLSLGWCVIRLERCVLISASQVVVHQQKLSVHC